MRDIVQKVEAGTAPGDVIVLTPRRKLGLRIAEQIREANISCREYLSESELTTPEVTERLALLRVACDQDDRPSLRWLLGYPQPAFRETQYKRLRKVCEKNGIAPWEALTRSEAGELPLRHCVQLVQRFREIREQVDLLRSMNNPIEALIVLFPPDEILFDQIRGLFTDELDQGLTLAQFRDMIWEKIFEPNFPDEVDYVRVMTLFGSKGLGSPVVYVTSLIDGLLPRQPDPEDSQAEAARKLQEQRRLFYVTLTRVKALPNYGAAGELTISSFRSFSYADAHSLNNGSRNALASRFLGELGPSAPQAIRR